MCFTGRARDGGFAVNGSLSSAVRSLARPSHRDRHQAPIQRHRQSSFGLADKHWRRQVWGTGARAPLDLQQFNFFSVLWPIQSLTAIIC